MSHIGNVSFSSYSPPAEFLTSSSADYKPRYEYGEKPNALSIDNSAPHKEVSNTALAWLFALNLLFGLYAIALSAGQIAIVEHCDSNCENGSGTSGQVFFAVAVVVIVLSVVAVSLSVFALATKSGFRQKSGYEAVGTQFEVEGGVRGFLDGSTSELARHG